MDRRVKFAVGLTTIILLVRWMLTGDLLFALSTVSGDSNTGSWLSAVWPMVSDVVVIVGASVISWSIRLWHLAYSLTTAAVERYSTPTSPAATGVGLNLARAVATGDKAEQAKLSARIRRPYLVDQIAEASERGEPIDALLDELRALPGGQDA